MKVMGYDVTIDIDGVESVVQLDDTYPSVKDWQSASEFAMHLADHMHPNAENILFVECSEFELEEYKSYGFIHEAPYMLQ